MNGKFIFSCIPRSTKDKVVVYFLFYAFPGLIWYQFGDLFAVKTMSQVSSPMCGDQLANYDHQARIKIARMYWGRSEVLTAVFLKTQVFWDVKISGVSKTLLS